jgi:type III restriction enzyme
MDEVRLFVKLPDWFTVPTPIGPYNPDWAVVFHVQDEFGNAREKLYAVRETKSGLDVVGRHALEKMKILCAQHHFGVWGVDYGDVMTPEDLPRKIQRE